MIIGTKEFRNRTYVMGILNVTPDSFSDGGQHNTLEAALKHTEQMIKDGADIIDIGGESTRPGFKQISDDEEIERVVPVIEAVKKNFDIPISVDTYKNKVAEAAFQAGADMLNDIWGLKYDDQIAKTVKKYNAACCIMHNRDNTEYTDFINNVIEDLRQCIDIAVREGIQYDKILIDPGVGFAKSYEQNLEIINNLEKLYKLGFPILLGTSRKSVIGNTLNLPVEERIEGTVATSVFAVIKECLFVRVHDVKENKRAIIMAEKILGRE